MAYLGDVEAKYHIWNNKKSKVDWAYGSEINDKNFEAQVKITKELNAFNKQLGIEFKKYDCTHFTPYNRRQFEKMAVIGTSALNSEDEKKTFDFTPGFPDSINNTKTKEGLIRDEKEGTAYLGDVDAKLLAWNNKIFEVNWAHVSDINEMNLEAKVKLTKELNAFQKQQSIETKRYDWTHFIPYNRRQFEKLAVIGISALNSADEKRFIKATNNMEKIYSTAKVCVSGNCMLELDPDLTKIMSESKNYNELRQAWVNWRDVTGKKMRRDFISYYNLGNKAAKLNELPNMKFETLDDLWLFSWETPDIKNQTENLLLEMMPFYAKLHAYVRKHLRKAYPGKMPKDKTIPAHILGNMWAQEWNNIMNTVPGVDPYPGVQTIDVTKELVKQNYTAKRMFELSDKFFSELGLMKVTDTFWQKSIIEKAKDKEMVCHASAWDFYAKTGDDFRIKMCTEINMNSSAWDFYAKTGDDFRIKMCTEINMNDLIVIHHEMGHI
ncbi:unnamed protein product, partial [Oppiella nova]